TSPQEGDRGVLTHTLWPSRKDVRSGFSSRAEGSREVRARGISSAGIPQLHAALRGLFDRAGPYRLHLNFIDCAKSRFHGLHPINTTRLPVAYNYRSLASPRIATLGFVRRATIPVRRSSS